MERKQWRQGDVVLEQERVHPVLGETTFARHGVLAMHAKGAQKSVVVAEGEKTGHSHVLESPVEIEMYERNGTLFLKTSAPATMKHPEHAPITVGPGEYRVVRQTEYDPEMGYRAVHD